MSEPQTLLLTRPRAQSEEFAAEISAALPGRFRVLIAPLIEIVALPQDPDLRGVAALAFTSANGVAQLAARTARRDLPAYCVGAITAESARAAGFEVEVAGGDAAALSSLISARQAPDAGPVLHVRGRHAAGDLAGRLAAAGIDVRPAEIYDQRPHPLDADVRERLGSGDVDALTFFSPRTARLFTGRAREARWDLRRATTVSLSLAVDAALDIRIGRRCIAAEPTRAAMIAELAVI